MFIIDKRTTITDRRQHQVPVWGDRRMPPEERIYREKLEKEWRSCDPTKEKVYISEYQLFNAIVSVLLFIIVLVVTI